MPRKKPVVVSKQPKPTTIVEDLQKLHGTTQSSRIEAGFVLSLDWVKGLKLTGLFRKNR